MSQEDLSPEQLAQLREALVTLQRDTEENLRASTADAKPVDLGLSIGRLSRVDALQHQQLAIARRQRVEIQLQQIRAALSRIDSADYGGCISCGEPIGFARLQARPESPVCRACQR